jgi:hypothetical protein
MGLLFIDVFFLPESTRKHGLGIQVIRMAEAESGRRGCTGAVVSTVTLQAPGFTSNKGMKYSAGSNAIRRVTLGSL